MEKQSENLTIFRDAGRLATYTSLALGLFFIAAMSVFILRNREAETVVMPDLVGKYYIDVHNDLIQSRMTIHLEHRSYPDQPHGIVLYQSIPAGSIVRTHDKVYVTVNEGEPVLSMPDLNGLSLSAARLTLERITRGEDVYSLSIGAITKIGIKGVPPGTVVGQFPSPEDTIMLHEKVYLLIAGPVERYPLASLKGQQIDLAIQWLHESGMEYRIRTVRKPDQGKGGVSGEVWNVDRMDDATVLLDVYYSEASYRGRTGYEFLEVELPGSESCSIRTYPVAGNRLQKEDRLVFQTGNHEPGEKVKVVFYRRGPVDLSGKCGDSYIIERQYYLEKPERA